MTSLDSGQSPVPLAGVPLFPLPNVVLFPRAILPLHVFEERYKAMTADALAGPRRIAMALLRPGWEKNYHGRAAICPVVCLGRILSCERLSDGKYNFLLQGIMRARIVREWQYPLGPDCYRRADLEPLVEKGNLEIDLEQERRRLGELFDNRPLARTPVGQQFTRLLRGPLPTGDIADLAAFNFIENIALKQELLEETDVRRRVSRTIDAVEQLCPMIEAGMQGMGTDPSVN